MAADEARSSHDESCLVDRHVFHVRAESPAESAAAGIHSRTMQRNASGARTIAAGWARRERTVGAAPPRFLSWCVGRYISALASRHLLGWTPTEDGTLEELRWAYAVHRARRRSERARAAGAGPVRAAAPRGAPRRAAHVSGALATFCASFARWAWKALTAIGMTCSRCLGTMLFGSCSTGHQVPVAGTSASFA